MSILKVGDLIQEKNNVFGQKDKIGKIIRVNRFGFLVYNVKYPNDKNIWEYHRKT